MFGNKNKRKVLLYKDNDCKLVNAYLTQSGYIANWYTSLDDSWMLLNWDGTTSHRFFTWGPAYYFTDEELIKFQKPKRLK